MISARISSPSAQMDGGQAMSTAVVAVVLTGSVIGVTGPILILKNGKDKKNFLWEVEQWGCCSIWKRAL